MVVASLRWMRWVRPTRSPLMARSSLCQMRRPLPTRQCSRGRSRLPRVCPALGVAEWSRSRQPPQRPPRPNTQPRLWPGLLRIAVFTSEVSHLAATTLRSWPALCANTRARRPLLFATRIARMFGYGLLSVVLVLYLVALGLPGRRDRAAAGAHAAGRRGHLAVADDARRPRRAPPGAHRRRLADAGGRPRLRRHADLRGARGRRDHRRHQPQRQRGRAVPGRRAGVAHPAHPCRRGAPACSPGTSSPGSFATAAGALAGGRGRPGRPRSGGGRPPTPTGRHRRLRRRRHRARRAVRARVAGRRGAAPRAPDTSIRAPPGPAPLAAASWPSSRRCSRSTRSAAAS